MRKISIFIQWVVVAALAAFIAYVTLRTAPEPDYTPATWRNWSGITVISYPGISRRTTPVYPSVKQLEAQLKALREEGYRTVKPEDVRAFLDKRAPLPDKALLLIFEGGRKEAFIRATPVLQKLGYSAVLATPTMVMEQWGNFYLKKRDVRKMNTLPQWSIGSMGHQAVKSIPGDAPENERRFLTRRIKVKGEMESPDSFRERVTEDYSHSAQMLKNAAGEPAMLYLYPYSDAGQYPGADPLADKINRDAVTRCFSLAVIGSSNAFNGPGTDPWALTRLRVPGDWTPERLVKELQSGQTRTQALNEIGAAENWIFERDAEWHSNELHLKPDSAAWLRGTENWMDAEISASLKFSSGGIASLYTRFTSIRSWLRVTLDAKGLSVQERLGDRLVTLFKESITENPSNEYRVKLRLRNNRAWVWLDDKPVAKNLPLSPATKRGRTGLGSRQSVAWVTDFKARPLPSRWILANSIRLIKEDDMDQVQAILPNWFRAGKMSAVSQTAKQDLLQASVAGIQTFPLLTGIGKLPEGREVNWAEAIDNELIRNNLKMLIPTLAIEGPALSLASELRNRNYRLVHLLTREEAVKWGKLIADESDDEVLIINDCTPEADGIIHSLLHTIPSARLGQREPDEKAIAPDIKTIHLLEPPPDH